MGCIVMQAAETQFHTTTTQKNVPLDEQGTINEMILAGKPWQAGHFLKPMLSELAHTRRGLDTG